MSEYNNDPNNPYYVPPFCGEIDCTECDGYRPDLPAGCWYTEQNRLKQIELEGKGDKNNNS